FVEDNDQHLVRAETMGVVKREVGEAMQTDRGLSAAGSALNHHKTRVGLRDELELARVDERRDLFEVLVLVASDDLAYAEFSAGGCIGPNCCSLAALEAERAVIEANPAVLAAMGEVALGAADAPELTFGDGQAAP